MIREDNVMAETRRNPLGTLVTGPPDALHDRICARLAREKKPASLPTRHRIVIALIIVPLLTAIVTFVASEIVYRRFGVGLEVDPARSMRLTWTLALLAGMAIASTAIAVWRGSRGFGPGAAGLAITSALVVPVYGVLTLVGPLHQYSEHSTGVAISPWGERCALIAAVVGLTVIASHSLALRRAGPGATGLRSAAIGAAAGAWSGLAVFTFCPSADLQHLIAGHIGPMIALSLFGAFATSRWLRP
jgi:hypothetical protein